MCSAIVAPLSKLYFTNPTSPFINPKHSMLADVSIVARVVGGKTARACDSCIRKRARWYCAADDAFLCQSCDSLVHSANPLARRHERVRLNTASFRTKADGGGESRSNRVPYWHSRKARTPRGKQTGSSKSLTSDEVARNPVYLVPEIMSDYTTSFDDADRQPLYGRVPVIPAGKAADPRPENVSHSEEQRSMVFNEIEMKGVDGDFCEELVFLQSEMDLEEFAADVETLLGKGLDDDSIRIDGLGLMQFGVEVGQGSVESSEGSGRVVKDEEEMEMASNDQPFELGIHFDDECAIVERSGNDYDVKVMQKRKNLLRLDYEGIISAWDGSSPWGSSTRFEVHPNECWPSCMGTCGIKSHELLLVDDHVMGTGGRLALSGDGEREARVSRYREKRGTRLFSKKIRYEVRKLNAEKRPRMKGRFVKRSHCSC